MALPLQLQSVLVSEYISIAAAPVLRPIGCEIYRCTCGYLGASFKRRFFFLVGDRGSHEAINNG